MERSEFRKAEYRQVIHTNENGGVVKNGNYVTTEPKPLQTNVGRKTVFEPLTVPNLVTPHETLPSVLRGEETIDMGKAPLIITRKNQPPQK